MMFFNWSLLENESARTKVEVVVVVVVVVVKVLLVKVLYLSSFATVCC